LARLPKLPKLATELDFGSRAGFQFWQFRRFGNFGNANGPLSEVPITAGSSVTMIAELAMIVAAAAVEAAMGSIPAWHTQPGSCGALVRQ
jgi:hypothetical protein